MINSIVTVLTELGFTIDQKKEMAITGHLNSFNNGGFDINVDLRDNSFSMKLVERFSETYVFLMQKFKDAEYLRELILGNYPFNEWVVDNSGEVEKLFKEHWQADPELLDQIRGNKQ